MDIATTLLGAFSVVLFILTMGFLSFYFRKKRQQQKKEFDLSIPILGTTGAGKTAFLTTLIRNIYDGKALPQGVSGEYLGEKEERSLKGIANSEPLYGESIFDVPSTPELIAELKKGTLELFLKKTKFLTSKAYIKAQDHNIWYIQDEFGEYKVALDENNLSLYPLYYNNKKRVTREAVTTEISRFYNKESKGTTDKENFYLNIVSTSYRLKTVFNDIKGGNFQNQNNFDSTGILKLIKESHGILLILNTEKFFDANGKARAGEEHITNYTYSIDQRFEIAKKQQETLPVWIIFTKGDLFPKDIQEQGTDQWLEQIPSLRSFQNQEGIRCFIDVISVNKQYSRLYARISETFRDFFQLIKENYQKKQQRISKQLIWIFRYGLLCLLLAIISVNETIVCHKFNQLKTIEKDSNLAEKEYESFQKYQNYYPKKLSISSFFHDDALNKKFMILRQKFQTILINNIDAMKLSSTGIFSGEDIQKIKDSIRQYSIFSTNDNFVSQVEKVVDIYNNWNELDEKMLHEKMYYITEVLPKQENVYTKAIISKIETHIQKIAQSELDKILDRAIRNFNLDQDIEGDPKKFLEEFREWKLRYKAMEQNILTAKENREKWYTKLQDIQKLYYQNDENKSWSKEKQGLFLIMLYKSLPRKEDNLVTEDFENFLQKTTEKLIRSEDWKKDAKEKDKNDFLFLYETRYKNDENIYKQILESNIRSYLREDNLEKNTLMKQKVKENFSKLKKWLAQKIDDANIGEKTKQHYVKDMEKYKVLEEKFDQIKLNTEITFSFSIVSEEHTAIYIHELYIGSEKINQKAIYAKNATGAEKEQKKYTFPWKPFSNLEVIFYNDDYGSDTYLGKYEYPKVFIPKSFSTTIFEEKIKVDFEIEINDMFPEEIKEIWK